MKLFVDIDGTLNEFQAVKHLEELYIKGRFLNAVPHFDVIEAVRWIIINTNIEVYILSAYLEHSKYALKEKSKWLDKYLPEILSENHIFVECGKSKADIVRAIFGSLDREDYLFDDYSINLHDWERAGGTGVKLLTGKNGSKGTWQGKSVNMHSDILGQLMFQMRRGGEEKCR